MIPPKIIIPNSCEIQSTVNNLNSEENKNKNLIPLNFQKTISNTFKTSKIHIGYIKWQDDEIKSLLEFSKSKPFNNWEDLTTQWNVIAEKNGFPSRNSKGIMNRLGRLKNSDKQSSVSVSFTTKLSNGNRMEWEEDEIKSLVVFLDSRKEEFDNWKDLSTQWNIIAKAKGFPDRGPKGIEHKLKRLQNPSDKLSSSVEPSSLKKIKFKTCKDKNIIVKPLDMYNLQSTQSEITQDLPPSTDCELDNLRNNVPDMVINLPNLSKIPK